MPARKLLFSFQLLVSSLFFLILTAPILAATSNQPLIPDEQAVYNLNQNLLAPEAVKDTPVEQNLIGEITSSIGSFISQSLTKLSSISFNGPKFFAQSQSINQAQIPTEVQPQSPNILEKLKGFLGGRTGVYSVSLPDTVGKSSDNVGEREKQFQQANFPPGVSPITGQ